MAITKTKFINYVRCPRYVTLDGIKKSALLDDMDIYEYMKEEEIEKRDELISHLIDEEGNDLIDVTDKQLNTMMPYYNEVELLAGSIASKYFDGSFKYSKTTYNQESFDAIINNSRYICYVDIYNENDDGINIIECKATTTKKYLNLSYKGKSIFAKDEKGIYRLLEELNIDDYMPSKTYDKLKEKLFDKYSPAGHYVYDLAVQRFIIENDLKQNGDDRKVNYYLGVLNSEYVFDGKYENGKPVYDEINGEEIISFIDLTSVTEKLMDKIDLESKMVSGYINDFHDDIVPLGKWCEKNKTHKCKFCPVCFDRVPSKNSIFSYMDSHHGFKKNNVKYTDYDLVNEGKVGILDIDESYLTRYKNVIQRRSVESGKPYIDVDKIKDGLDTIKYPVYHLDFETFPCPLPRYRGERPYTLSVFQFSLHIEKEPGVCDNDKDHFGFLSKDHLDRREELIKYMCDLIGDGTVIVYNESFEKTRIKELSLIFPKYRDKLLKINDQIFDLMNIVKTKTKMYEKLGYDKDRAKLINYYHPSMDGSYSIKKVLPVFSSLTYQGMEVANGVDAMITYASFPKLNDKEFKHRYQKLVEYCKQDTYAMYKVLEGLRKCVK